MSNRFALSSLILTLFTLLTPGLPAAPLQSAFLYQGHLQEQELHANGTYDMTFRLYWLENGPSPASEPLTNSAVKVQDGLFTVALDFGHAVWIGNNLWLEIGIRPANTTEVFTLLSPRQPVTPAPYALFADEARIAQLAAAQSITADMLADSLSTNLAFLNRNAAFLGTVTAANFVGSGGGLSAINSLDAADGAPTDAVFVDGDGRVGIGTITPAADLHVQGSSGIGSVLVTPSGTDANAQIVLTENSTATLGMILRYEGGDAGNPLHVFGMNRDIFNGPHLTIERDSGRVGIGQPNPAAPLHVAGTIRSDTSIESRNPNNLGAHVGFSWLNNVARIRVGGLDQGSANGLDIQGISDASLLRLENNGTATVANRLNVGSTLNLHSSETGTDGAELLVRDSNGRSTINLDSEQTGGGSQITMLNGEGVETIRIDADQSDGAVIELRKQDGSVGILLDATNSIGGSLITTDILRITGGADIAEPFEVGPQILDPGMVVSIDPENPGELRPSQEAYDRKVAGVISGAGGVRPGLTLEQDTTLASGKQPVALSGRVYCWCDVSGGAIEPGDLLTTSGQVGHAMKVTDYVRSQGAVVGKAMTPLSSGRGLVLVLVNLN